MKLQLFDEDGIEFPLRPEDSIKVVIPYHKDSLQKSIDFANVKSGMIDLSLNEFEIEGLKEQRDQTFWILVDRGQKRFTFKFEKQLHVVSMEGKKVIE